MTHLLASKSTYVFQEESSCEPTTLDPYLQDMTVDTGLISSPLPSPPESPKTLESDEIIETKSISEDGKRLRELLRIRNMLRSRTGSQVRKKIRIQNGSLSIPVYDHLKYKDMNKNHN